MNGSRVDERMTDRSDDRRGTEAAGLLDAVFAAIRDAGLDGVMTACYLRGTDSIRIAAVGTVLEDGRLLYGVDYPATLASRGVISGHLVAFSVRQASGHS